MIHLLVLALGALVATVFQIHICPDEIRAWMPMVPYLGPTYAWFQSVVGRLLPQNTSMITTPRCESSCCGLEGERGGGNGTSSSIVG